MLITSLRAGSQSPMPEILSDGTLKEQMNYLEERTRIYENYRAIREDMFQKIKSNSLDSLIEAKIKVNDLLIRTLVLNSRIDSLENSLSDTQTALEEVTDTKNNISVLGLDLNKSLYNSIMWITVAVLLSLLSFGFLAFKRVIIVSSQTKKELEDMKIEFEAYRQKTREAREKMSMEHFNEIKRLKGS